MNGMQAFFKKYHAVPANNDGPKWSQASDDALCGWAKDDCKAWDANPAAREGMRGRMTDMASELDRRAKLHTGDDAGSVISRELFLHVRDRLLSRIGFDALEK